MPQSRYLVCIMWFWKPFPCRHITLPAQTNPQVFYRLQRLQLCISYAALLKILDEGAIGHNEKVTEWQETLQECVTCNMPNVSVL